MKKIVLTIVAMLSMTMAFGETTKNKIDAAYTINVNNNALSRSLALTEEQQYAVNEIITRFEYDMRRVAKSSEIDRQKRLRKAVNRNLAMLSRVLTPAQYRKYMLVLNATFVNRGINTMM